VHFAWCIDYLGRRAQFRLAATQPALRRRVSWGLSPIARKPHGDKRAWWNAGIWDGRSQKPLESTVADFVEHLDAAEYERKQRAPREHEAVPSFIDLTDTRDLLRQLG